MTTQTQQMDPKLKTIPLGTAAVGFTILLISLLFYRDFAFAAGLIVGVFLVIVNFVFLTKIVVKLLDQNYKRKSFLGLLFFFKLIFMAAVLGLAFVILKVNAIAFVLGYLSLVPAILYQQLKG